jgi:phosphoglycolate phosphatase-like HAD superfamily hydrolase
VTGDDVGHQKPHPEGVLRVARELSIAPNRCVFVGDSPADLGAGLDAKMFSVVAGWHPWYHDELREHKPDLWAQTPLELRDFLVREEN